MPARSKAASRAACLTRAASWEIGFREVHLAEAEVAVLAGFELARSYKTRRYRHD
jgi:hypothetical protein